MLHDATFLFCQWHLQLCLKQRDAEHVAKQEVTAVAVMHNPQAGANGDVGQQRYYMAACKGGTRPIRDHPTSIHLMIITPHWCKSWKGMVEVFGEKGGGRGKGTGCRKRQPWLSILDPASAVSNVTLTTVDACYHMIECLSCGRRGQVPDRLTTDM